ncbi:hypothetical protein D9M70_651540 [compost metagenome]
MKVISSVPANRGMAPKISWLTSPAAVPAPVKALWGDQWSPNRNLRTGISPKNRSDSKISESTIPIVVSTATTEQAMRNTRTTRSTTCRARNEAVMLR